MQLQKNDSKGLPCKHIFHVLKYLNISELPKCLVLVRFTKEARLGLTARRTSDLLGFGWTGAGERMKYSQVSVLCDMQTPSFVGSVIGEFEDRDS